MNLVRFPATFFIWVVLTLLSYEVLAQAVKTWYLRRFRAWL